MARHDQRRLCSRPCRPMPSSATTAMLPSALVLVVAAACLAASWSAQPSPARARARRAKSARLAEALADSEALLAASPGGALSLSRGTRTASASSPGPLGLRRGSERDSPRSSPRSSEPRALARAALARLRHEGTGFALGVRLAAGGRAARCRPARRERWRARPGRSRLVRRRRGPRRGRARARRLAAAARRAAAAGVAAAAQGSCARRLQPRLCRRGRCAGRDARSPKGASWPRAPSAQGGRALAAARAQQRRGASGKPPHRHRRLAPADRDHRGAACGPTATSSAGRATSPISKASRGRARPPHRRPCRGAREHRGGDRDLWARHAAHLLQHRLRPALAARGGLARDRADARRGAGAAARAAAPARTTPISAPSSASSARCSPRSSSRRKSCCTCPTSARCALVVSPHPFGGLIFAYEDVTDRLALERSYNTSIEVQRETLDNLYEAIAVFGSDGRLKLWNPAYAPDLAACARRSRGRAACRRDHREDARLLRRRRRLAGAEARASSRALTAHGAGERRGSSAATARCCRRRRCRCPTATSC